MIRFRLQFFLRRDFCKRTLFVWKWGVGGLLSALASPVPPPQPDGSSRARNVPASSLKQQSFDASRANKRLYTNIGTWFVIRFGLKKKTEARFLQTVNFRMEVVCRRFAFSSRSPQAASATRWKFAGKECPSFKPGMTKLPCFEVK